jgi:hypothetical protein
MGLGKWLAFSSLEDVTGSTLPHPIVSETRLRRDYFPCTLPFLVVTYFPCFEKIKETCLCACVSPFLPSLLTGGGPVRVPFKKNIKVLKRTKIWSWVPTGL